MLKKVSEQIGKNVLQNVGGRSTGQNMTSAIRKSVDAIDVADLLVSNQSFHINGGIPIHGILFNLVSLYFISLNRLIREESVFLNSQAP